MNASSRHGATAALALALLLHSAPGFACRCAGPLSPETAYGQADLVVLGETLSVDGDPYGKGGAEVCVAVDRAWKQATPTKVRIRTSTSCAFDFKAGEAYLLYLRRAEDGDHYVARACQGNEIAAEASVKLQWLDAQAEPASIGD